MKIYTIDSTDYVVAGTTEFAAETYADVRGKDAQTVSLFKGADNTIISGLPVIMTPSFDDVAYQTAGARVYPASAVTFKEDDLVVITAVPPADTPAITFVEWRDGSGTQLSTDAEYQFNISTDMSIVAVFTGL